MVFHQDTASSSGLLQGSTICGQFKEGKLIGPTLYQSFSDDGFLAMQSIGPAELPGMVSEIHLLGYSDVPARTQYEGERNNESKVEHGIAHYPDGTRYEGQWLQGELHGFGVKLSNEGKVVAAGYWQNGSIQGILEIALLEEAN